MSVSIASSTLVPKKLLAWIWPFLGSLLVLMVGLWISSSLIAVSILVCALSIWMMHGLVDVFNLKRVNICSFFYLIYLAIILIPGFFVFRDETTASRMRYLFGIESVLITVPAGIFLANQILRFRRQEIAAYFDARVDEEPGEESSLGVFVALLVVGLLFVAVNIRQMPAIPLLYLIRNPGEALTVATLREDAFKLLDSPLTYVYYIFRGSVFPFLAMVALGRYRVGKEAIWRNLFWISFLCGVGYAALTIEKSPVATFIGLLFLFSYLLKGGRLNKRAALVFPILFLSFPATVILLAYKGTEGGTVMGLLQAIGDRIFFGPAKIVYAYFELFPTLIPYQHGASLVKLAHLLGWQTIDIPNVVGLYVNGGLGGLSSVSANGCFIGNLNADFGTPGVVIGGVLAGLVMQMVSIYFLRRPKTATNLAGHAACMWSFGLLVASPLPTVLLSGGVAFAIVLAWCLGYTGYRASHGVAAR